ncbi:MAG: TatD family hydrolase, partial [Planctomycetota bacterium]
MEFFDTHCHLDFPDYAEDRDAVVDRALEAGVAGMVVVGTCLETSRLAIRLADEYDEVHAAVGIHPNHCADHDESVLDPLAEMATHEHVVAVGETGLDFYRDRTPRELQERFFRRHLRIAADLGKPVILHSRDSGGALMDVIESVGADAITGVFHCFTAGPEVLRRALGAGLRIGLSGIVTFPKGDNVRAVVPDIPDDALLLDSDAPFLAPAPHRGQR